MRIPATPSIDPHDGRPILGANDDATFHIMLTQLLFDLKAEYHRYDAQVARAKARARGHHTARAVAAR